MTDDTNTDEETDTEERNDSEVELDPLSQRLKALADRDRSEVSNDMVEDVTCSFCGEKHLGEVYASPPDGFYIRYWCSDTERRHRTSFD